MEELKITALKRKLKFFNKDKDIKVDIKPMLLFRVRLYDNNNKTYEEHLYTEADINRELSYNVTDMPSK